MSSLTELYFANQQKKLDFRYFRGEDYTNFISIKGVISILKTAIEMIEVKGHSDEILKPYDSLKASFDIYFKGNLVPEMFELY